ncbi:MAG: hypothetical protein R3228_16245 [Halioglobus sp.]|nr:hypothetical protein [Halioglobus sp.]
MSAKDAALDEIVEIARLNGLSASDIAAALNTSTGGEGVPGGSIIRRLLAFIGGIFVFAGVIVYIGMFWEDMNSAARIIITLGTGVVALVIAILLLDHDRFASAATPLFLIAAWLQPTGIMVAFDELGSGGDPQHALLATTTVMLMQQLLVYTRFQLPVLLFVALFFGTLTFGNAFDLIEVDEEVNVTIVGLSLLLLSFGIDKTSQRGITPFWFFVGGAAFLWGVFELIEGTPFHLVYLGLTAFMIYLSTVARSRTLLFVSTLAMIGYLGYFTAEYFVDSTGWPVALVFMGLALIGVSNMALRVNRKYIAGP